MIIWVSYVHVQFMCIFSNVSDAMKLMVVNVNCPMLGWVIIPVMWSY